MGNISSPSIVDNINVSCIYSNANNVIISGAEQFGDLVTINNDGGIYNKIQLYIEASIGGVFLRVKENNSWMSWHKILSDVPSFYKNYADIVSLTSDVKQTMKVSQKTLVVPANGSNSELGLQANPFIVIKADTMHFNGCIVLLCDHINFTVLGNYGGFDSWVTLSRSEANLVIQNNSDVQLRLPVFTFVG